MDRDKKTVFSKIWTNKQATFGTSEFALKAEGWDKQASLTKSVETRLQCHKQLLICI